MPQPEHVSPSEQLIPPEIIDDAFYSALQWLAAHEPLHHILEIGSSAGAGSTKALVRGVLLNPFRPALYCMEISKTRFALLKNAYGSLDFVKMYNVSSVPEEHYPSDGMITDFYQKNRTALNQYPIDMVLGWKSEGLRYLRESGVQQDGIGLIKADNNIANFDLVLIDGGEFTGFAEFQEVYGANIICMDDVNTFKCYRAREELLANENYELVLEDFATRNGFSIFMRRDFPSQWLYVKHVTESLLSRNHAGPKRAARAADADEILARDLLNDRLDARLAELRQSRSWRMTAPLRGSGESPLSAPLPVEAKLDALLAAFGSLSWEITAPLRLSRRLLRWLRG